MTPLTDYDPAPGLIAPDFEHLDLHLPCRGVFAFLSEKRIARFVEERNGKQVGTFLSITKPFPIYVIPAGGEEIALMQAPVGAPAAVLMEERLFAYGVEKLLAIGCAGSLTDLPENMFFPIQKALRDEGTSCHYLPAERFIEFDKEPLEALLAYFRKQGLPARPAATWSSDGFFRETKEKIQRRKQEGCQLVDMEAAALAASARFRRKTFGEILFTADTLANLSHDTRHWGTASRTAALTLAADAVLSI